MPYFECKKSKFGFGSESPYLNWFKKKELRKNLQTESNKTTTKNLYKQNIQKILRKEIRATKLQPQNYLIL